MTVIEVARSRLQELEGRVADAREIQMIRQALPERLVPDWLAELLTSIPIVGVRFSLKESDDQSGLGAEMEILSVDQMIDEAVRCYPGIVAHPLGYLPIGSCQTGSGDYYYLDLRTSRDTDPRVLRLPHDAVSGDKYLESAIEVVAERFSDFIRIADIA